MSSIIEGYNYDIFISYRQKDNKHDGWVAEFVENLKGELDTTFKEDVSVYFDENPHNRLQETHNVDKSLEGKLKCLIFIPILSQTYCDPNSYAWQYEFLTFLRMAELDRLGKDVRLRSGNVASRIVPIRIHDLEQEDIKLFEKETGSVLRSLDFVFKTSTGVNRTLKANEDHPNDNLNKTFYSDQINKVVLAIKEILLGLKTEHSLPEKERAQIKQPTEEVKKKEKEELQVKTVKIGRLKLLSTFAALAILIMIGIFVYPKIFKKNTIEKLRSSGERISVAVMPFQNLTNEIALNVYSDVIQTSLANLLSNYSEELKVRQSESVNFLIQGRGIVNYASITPSLAGDLSQKLNADLFVFGIISKNGSILRVNAQLTDSKTEEIIRSFQVEGLIDKIYPIIDSLSNMVRDFLIISKFIKEVPPDVQHIGTTNSPEASKYYTYGFHVFYDKRDYAGAREWFLKALNCDTNFVGATIMISYSFGNQALYNEAKEWCLKAYRKKDLAPLKLRFNIDMAYASYFTTPVEEIKYCLQLLEIDDQSPHFYYRLGNSYSKLFQYNKVISALEKALAIYNNWGVKPQWVFDYTYLGMAYHCTGQYNKEREIYKRAEKEFPDDAALIYRQAILSLTEKDTVSANRQIEKYISTLKNSLLSDAEIVKNLAEMYSEAGLMDKAEGYYQQAHSSEPENPALMNNLAYFQIDKDRSINEGLELVDKGLKFSPDNYNYLHTKGWGLYKHGQYQEALVTLQKSWDLRIKNAVYDHAAFLHLEAAKKSVASQKNN